MRPIKFRARDKESGKWFYFTLNELVNGATQTSEFCDTELIDWCEYTGLDDKNEVPIYEGDICWVNFLSETDEVNSFNIEIEFKDGAFCFLDKPISSYLGLMMEVKGNKFENPELLKS
jgi:hypothetical protein